MAEDFEVGGPLPEESTNRPFIIAAGVIGGLLVLSMICLGLYALVWAPRQREAGATEAANIILQNTQVALSITETNQAHRASVTPTATNTPVPSPTATATRTQVVVLPTNTPTAPQPTVDPLTRTAAAQATIAALAGGRTPTTTALPATGFADEVGAPSLLLLGAVLVAVVIIARRLRAGTST
jgi:hypothetical protein